MEATCDNGNCEKVSWTLQKHPSEYSRGVTCPSCGTTNVSVEGAAEEKELQRASGGGQETRPTTVSGGAGGAVDAVLTATDGEAGVRERAEATQTIFQKAGGIVARILEYEEQKNQAREEVAQKAEVERIDQYPECEDCGYTFTGDDIDLSSDKIKCPGCGAAYRLQSPQ